MQIVLHQRENHSQTFSQKVFTRLWEILNINTLTNLLHYSFIRRAIFKTDIDTKQLYRSLDIEIFRKKTVIKAFMNGSLFDAINGYFILLFVAFYSILLFVSNVN